MLPTNSSLRSRHEVIAAIRRAAHPPLPPSGVSGPWLNALVARGLHALPPHAIFPQKNDSFFSDRAIDHARITLAASCTRGSPPPLPSQAECFLIGMAFFDPCLDPRDPSSHARQLYYALLGLECDALASCGQLVDDEPMVMLHYAHGLLLDAAAASDQTTREHLASHVLDCLARSTITDPIAEASHALLLVELILESPNCTYLALMPQLHSEYDTWETQCKQAAELLAESPQGSAALKRCIPRWSSRGNEANASQVLQIIAQSCGHTTA